MAPPPPPTLRLAIDHAALTHNWCVLDALSGTARAGAAIKADCYGLGVEQCLPSLVEAGARDFFVAHWSEVAAALNHVEPAQIAVLHGPGSKADAAYARATGVLPVINSLSQAKLWIESGGGPCHLMVDTGINRLGLTMNDIGDPLVGSLQVEVLMSHLACADEDRKNNARQLAAFQNACAAVSHKESSLANSAAIALGSAYHADLTRPGLSLYGGIPRTELTAQIQQVVYPQAAIIQRRSISSGDQVGYNGEFTAPGAMQVGVVSLGYADGILRAWKGQHFVHGNRKLAILGKVSMDMIVVDLSEADDLREGDWVDLPYSLVKAADQTGLSQYELLTVLGQRFERT